MISIFSTKNKSASHILRYIRLKLTRKNKNCNGTHKQFASVATARTNKSNYTTQAEHMQTQLIYRICRCIRICQHESQGKELCARRLKGGLVTHLG